jgi:hypothetical protein
MAAEPAQPGGPVPVLVGPLVQLPEELQQLAIDCLAFLPSYSGALLKAAALTCRLDCLPSASAARLAGVLLRRAAALLPPAEQLQLLASLLAPAAGRFADRWGAPLGAGAARHRQLVRLVCREAAALGRPLALLHLLEPWLLQQLEELREGGAEALRRMQHAALMLMVAGAAGMGGGGGRARLSGQLPAGLAAASAELMAGYCCGRGEGQGQEEGQGERGGEAEDGPAARVQLARQLLQLAPSLLWPLLQQLQAMCASAAGTAAFDAVMGVLSELCCWDEMRAVVMQGQAQLAQLLQALAAAAAAAQGAAAAGNLQRVRQLQALARDLYGVC